MGELAEKKRVLEQAFKLYDWEMKGHLTPVQVQTLHADLRISGISYPQVLASMTFSCLTDCCEPSDLYDLLQEMDRRYFLIQNYRWEFTMLDRLQKNSITINQARWFVQGAQGKHFSKRKWEEFLKSRPSPSSDVCFHEIEVMLCDIPSRHDLENELKEQERLRQDELRKQHDLEIVARKEKERQEAEKEEMLRKKIQEREKEEEQKRKRQMDDETKQRQEVEETKKRQDEEERQKEEERLRELEERNRLEEERRLHEEEEKYKNAEKLKEEAETNEKDLDDQLKKLDKEKEAANDLKKKDLEKEEKELKRKHKESKHKRIRYSLKVAIKQRDKFQLEYSVKEFKKENLEDTDMDLARAEKLIKELTSRDKLKNAMTKREIEELEKAVEFVKKHGFEVQLAHELIEANKLLGRLRRLERIRHEILELKQATVAEIRSYSKPPVVVHTVMTATLLLLGHKEKDTKDWKAVQSLVGKTGKESIKRRCIECDASKLRIEIAKRSKHLLGNYELDDVRDVSAGAATFYVWATAMIEECIDQHESSGAT